MEIKKLERPKRLKSELTAQLHGHVKPESLQHIYQISAKTGATISWIINDIIEKDMKNGSNYAIDND